MKKGLVMILSTFIVMAAMFQGCNKNDSTAPEEPTVVPATNTPTPIAWSETILIDDMEYLATGEPGADNANAIPASKNGPGYWYTYDDLADNGDSIVWPMSETAFTKYGYPAPFPTFEMTSPGNGNTGYCARVTGVVTTTFQWGFVGMGVNFLTVNADQSKKPVDISNMTGVRFYVKGDGKEYRIKLPSQYSGFLDGVSDNHFGRKFTSTTDWTQVDIPFTNFTQESGWGTTPINLTDALKYVDSIQFQTVGQPWSSIDLSIDNLEVYK
ncbi:MAG: CIA30 family protein [Candidatus Goldbacteria bacterium]|nr:CIA30 family protein [Candidatus Goldiibacteriota bacterium]